MTSPTSPERVCPVCRLTETVITTAQAAEMLCTANAGEADYILYMDKCLALALLAAKTGQPVTRVDLKQLFHTLRSAQP